MHGAGLTHITVMPQHGALIELLPKYESPSGRPHFKIIAKWRKLIYKFWWNKDPMLEYKNHFTRVPPKIIVNFVNDCRAEMCMKQLQENRR